MWSLSTSNKREANGKTHGKLYVFMEVVRKGGRGGGLNAFNCFGV